VSNLSERLVLPSGYRCLQLRLQPILGSVSIQEIAGVKRLGFHCALTEHLQTCRRGTGGVEYKTLPPPKKDYDLPSGLVFRTHEAVAAHDLRRVDCSRLLHWLGAWHCRSALAVVRCARRNQKANGEKVLKPYVLRWLVVGIAILASSILGVLFMRILSAA